MIIHPLKTSFKIDEQRGDVAQQIKDRVNSEDNFTHARRYHLTEVEDKVDILCPRIGRINNT